MSFWELITDERCNGINTVRNLAVSTLLVIALACSNGPAPSSMHSSDNPQTWEQLRQRPIKLPDVTVGDPCPTATRTRPSAGFGTGAGAGPAYAVGDTINLGVFPFNKVLWIVDPKYIGPVIIRGANLVTRERLMLQANSQSGLQVAKTVPGPSGQVDFYLELHIPQSPKANWRSLPSYSYPPTQGCWAWQVDGLSFNEVIPFRAS